MCRSILLARLTRAAILRWGGVGGIVQAYPLALSTVGETESETEGERTRGGGQDVMNIRAVLLLVSKQRARGHEEEDKRETTEKRQRVWLELSLHCPADKQRGHEVEKKLPPVKG